MAAATAPQVICLGEALVDRLGPLGGDPATTPAQQCDDRLGGAPANVACALARLGTPAALAGRLGSDAIGEALRQLLLGRGVDQSALQSDPTRPSRIVLVRRDARGDRNFGGFTGDRGEGFADQALDAAALEGALSPLLREARWLQVGTIPLATPASAAALTAAMKLAAQAQVAVALDVNWRSTFWDPAAAPDSGPTAEAVAVMRPLLEQAALIKLAAEEARWLFGSIDPVAIRAALPQQPSVVVTDGSAQVAWCFGSSSGVMPAYPVAVVDSTGAGDAFLAGLLHQLCQQPKLLDGGSAEAVRFASACGALVCGGAGAIDPQPTQDQVEVFLAGRL
ncbi:MAG: carbohydrate kinase [Cyanobacteria bacterium K_DeepCast_35m_m1_288]|nr:carbohydrate kinase [Cyanobacteria bacterium K_DeepCast_35m_m1_288]